MREGKMKKYVVGAPFMDYFQYSKQFMWILILLSQLPFNIKVVALEITVPNTYWPEH